MKNLRPGYPMGRDVPVERKVLFWFLLACALLLFFLSPLAMRAQERSNTYYAAQFPGADVGAKVVNAQTQCGVNTSLPCIVVIDAILAVWPRGTMPAICSNCAWIDYTKQGSVGFTRQGITYDAVTYGAKCNGVADDSTAINAAIAAAETVRGKVVLPQGTCLWSGRVSNHGGWAMEGAGYNDFNAVTPGTLLQYNGTCTTADMLTIKGVGGPSNRLDGVSFSDFIIDGQNCARYTLRLQTIDVSSFHRVRIRNGKTANFYEVDATGTKWYDVGLTICPSWCGVWDWGTGGFNWFGGQTSQAVSSTHENILVQGNTNTLSFYGMEQDANADTFVGFIKTLGFDTNSAMPDAPTGGAGGPSNVNCIACNLIYAGATVAASQGADVLVTGTATNPSVNVKFTNTAFSAGGIAATTAVKTDFAQDVVLSLGQSSGHTNTITATANSIRTALNFFRVGDTNAVAAGSATVLTVAHGSGGQFTVGGSFGHLGVSSISVPGLAAGANAGTSPPAPVADTGNTDNSGGATFGTGTTPAAGAQVVITFANPFNVAPRVVVSARNTGTQALGLYVSSITTTGFTLSCTTAPAASQANNVFSFDWLAIPTQ